MTNEMWGGRFAAGPAAIMEEINASIGFDRKLYAQDIRGSQAHCRMLVAQGILGAADGDAILAGLGDGIGIENDAAGLDLGAVAAHAVLAHHGRGGLLIVLRGGLGLGSNGPDSEEDRRSCKEE